MKVALVHDWLTGMRGGERCLEAFLQLYPDADIYTLLHVPGATSKEIDKRVVQTSFIQNIPCAKKIYRLLLPLYPFAVKNLKIESCDLVISLSHAAAKNVRVPPDATHICYCFTPMRYIWDQARQYFGSLTFFLWPIITFLRAWDRAGSRSVDHFIAISSFVAARIRCYYNRSSKVIYPPVRTDKMSTAAPMKGERAFLYAGALVPYKLPDVAIEACRKLNLSINVVGGGPMESKLRKLQSESVLFFGRVSDSELQRYMQSCRALLFPGKEDFGIIPIECLAAGRPVIAGYHGALRESLPAIKWWQKPEVTKSSLGVFSKMPDTRAEQVSELCKALQFYIDNEASFSKEACKNHAEKFSVEAFYRSWNEFLAANELPIVEREQDVKAKAAAI